LSKSRIAFRHRVIAIADVDHLVLVQNVVTFDAQLARIRVHDLERITLAQIRTEHRLLVGSVACVFRLDETHRARRPADRFQMIEHFLHQQIADVVRPLEMKRLIARLELRHDHLLKDLIGRGHQMKPSDAAHVRFEKTERVLPM
jgi:hypothetical protein